MPEGDGLPPAPPPGGPPPAAPGGKRPAIGLQIKLPSTTLDEVKVRYGDDLRQGRFFIRTKSPRAKDTLVRLEAQLSSGAHCFRAAAVVARVVEAGSTDAGPQGPGMGLNLLAIDDAGRDLILSLGGKPPPALKLEAASRPAMPAIKAAPPAAQPSAPPAPAASPLPPLAAAPTAAPPAPVAEPPPPAEPAVPREPPASTRPAPPVQPPPTMVPGATRPAVVDDSHLPAPEPKKPEPSKPGKKGPMIGIDLGTTNSCAAVVKDQKPFVIPSREGYNTIPSIVALNEKGKLIVGHPAKGQLLINPKNTVYGAKRLVGRQFTSQVVTELADRFAYKIVAGPRGEAAVQLGDQQFSLQKISALVLSEVKEIAQQWLQTEVTRAVITVPAYYNDNQRQAVREAGELAGLKVERILNEPTAAALAFAHGRELEQRVIVYDLGGGTFDASVLELHGNVYEVVSTGGDTFLGGVDFDRVLVDHLLACFRDQHGIEFPGDRVALQRITDAAERAKIALSEALEYKVRVPFVALVGDKPYDLEATLTRTELVALTGHLVDRTLKVCEEVLAARGLKPADLAEVLLVGGQSRMPLVRERIRNYFGREPSKAVHPDEAVALGAALLADSIESGQINGVVLIDVLPMSIGVGLPGGRFKKIIERNTSLPHKKSMSLSTTRDDQESLEIVVFQGDSDKAQDNEYLGTLLVPDLPKATRGTVSFDIMFALSVESILTVTAEEHATARTVTATFSTGDTPESVRQRLQKDAPPEETAAAADAAPGTALAATAAPGGGFVGWLKRLFGGSPTPRG
jgi:molecular chaperone DnaK